MKKLICGIVAGWLACAGLVVRAEEAAVAEGKNIALAVVGEWEASLVEEIRQFMEENSLFPVRLLPATEALGVSLDQEGVAAAKAMGPQDAFLVVLLLPTDGSTSHGVYLPGDRVAVVNAAPMKAGADDPLVYKRRLIRQAMRSVGMLQGLESCPNPQCCMTAYGSLGELDQMGMNFCPPCWIREERAGLEKGMKKIEIEGFAP